MEMRAARWMAVGITSLEDWPMLTWSLGWTGSLEPSSPPRIWMARLEITSLAFMFVEVPEPVWKTSSDELVVESYPPRPPRRPRRWRPLLPRRGRQARG